MMEKNERKVCLIIRIPHGVPCKDDYFDTMGIKAIVLIFGPKPLEMAGFLTLLRKSATPGLGERCTGSSCFCAFHSSKAVVIVDLLVIVLLFNLSSLNKSIQKHNNLMGCQPYAKHRFR